MRIRRIEIRGFQQFEHTALDFTNPSTGEAVDKVCFIGRNGTGKSTILRLLDMVLRYPRGTGGPAGGPPGALFFDIESSGQYFCLAAEVYQSRRSPTYLLRGDIDTHAGWRDEFTSAPRSFNANHKYGEYLLNDAWDALTLAHNAADLLLYSPAESASNQAMGLSGMPSTYVSQALALAKQFPFYHTASQATVSEMWRLLIYQVLRREEDRQKFESRPENLDRTKRELLEEFDRTHPEVLHELGRLWNKLLAPAGLEFDAEGASRPVQLGDNLEAHIRIKATGQPIPYGMLSTGMRDFLFRIGHIYLCYFNRRIERGFLLIDEPENSLFPDFLFELMEVYDAIVRNPDGTTGTQIFMATHNPIIAAQFEPYERIILEWDDHGHVTAKKGTAPVGDDPNDVLEQDFQLAHLMGKEGQKMWREYLDLRKRARRSTDFEEQKELVRQASEIAQRYRFRDS